MEYNSLIIIIMYIHFQLHLVRLCNQHLFLQFGNKKPKTPLSHDRCQEFLEKAKKNDQNRMLLDFLNSDSAQNLKLICKRCGMESIERSARAFFSSNGTRKRFFCFS